LWRWFEKQKRKRYESLVGPRGASWARPSGVQRRKTKNLCNKHQQKQGELSRTLSQGKISMEKQRVVEIGGTQRVQAQPSSPGLHDDGNHRTRLSGKAGGNQQHLQEEEPKKKE